MIRCRHLLLGLALHGCGPGAPGTAPQDAPPDPVGETDTPVDTDLPADPEACVAHYGIDVPETVDALAERYETDIHPLFARGLAEGGCADCHMPGTSHKVVIYPEDAGRTFDALWAGGWFAFPGGLSAIVQPDAVPRMPLGAPEWAPGDREALEAFSCAATASELKAAAPCSGPIDPGVTPLRRLSNWQYAQTIAASTGADPTMASALAADDIAHGFDAVGAAQNLSPGHFDRYQEAAEAIADDTIDLPRPLTVIAEAELGPVMTYTGVPVDGSQPGWGGPQPGGTFLMKRIRQDLQVGPVPVVHPGTYTLTVRARGRGGTDCVMVNGTCDVQDPHDLPELRVAVAGGEVDRVEWDSPLGSWGPMTEWSTEIQLAGPEMVQVGHGNASWGPSFQRDVELEIDWVQLEGPADDELPVADLDRLDRFLICEPDEAGCAEQTIEAMLSLLWRRAPTAAEVDRYVAVLELGEAEEGVFEDGVRLALEAALSSPHFLFRPEPDLTEAVAPLTAEALAVRLSYLVWGEAPDAALRAKAADDTLRDPTVLLQELDRLLADEKAAALADHFAHQWWQLGTLDDITFSPLELPDFDDALKQAMVGELRQLFWANLQADAPMTELLDRDTTWVNDRLAAHYGLPLPGTDALVEVPVGLSPRGGLIESAGLLALTSHPAKTSPTRRGKWLLQQLLCQPPAEPPDNVETDIAEPDPGSSTSLREMLEAHRADPACAACHATMDPLGLSLEHFDPLGAWRLLDDYGATVDPAVDLPTGVMLADHHDTIDWIATHPAHTTCIAQNVVVYAVGRGPDDVDACALEAIHEDFEAGGFTLRSLLRAVVSSPVFTQARGEAPAGGR